MDNPFRARNEVAFLDRIGPYVMTIGIGLIGLITATNSLEVIQLLSKVDPALGNLIVAGAIGAIGGGTAGYLAWRTLQRIGHGL